MLVCNLLGLPLHRLEHQLLIGQELLQAADGGPERISFLSELAGFQGSQPPEGHAEHGITLHKASVLCYLFHTVVCAVSVLKPIHSMCLADIREHRICELLLQIPLALHRLCAPRLSRMQACLLGFAGGVQQYMHGRYLLG